MPNKEPIYITVVEPSVEIMKFSSPTGKECLLEIEKAMRTCYKSEYKMTGKVEDSIALFKRTIFRDPTHPHTAMLEFASATVKFICDRGVSHELVRHRLASFAQESTRYCNYSVERFGNKIAVINPLGAFNWPADTEGHIPKYDKWFYSCNRAAEDYFDMIALGCTPQEARSVLPNSTKTEVTVKMNFREWLHFFHMRDDEAAHPQMRQLASKLHEDFRKEVPYLFD